jgi:enamine deaminase RidA (YjgF/YER057c/UK114 family)
MTGKQFDADIGHCLVDISGIRRFFAAVAPKRGATFSQQADDALQTLHKLVQDAGRTAIVMQTVFLGDLNDQPACRKLMRDFYGAELPATTYVPQPPCTKSLLAIEAWGVGLDPVPVDAREKSGSSPPESNLSGEVATVERCSESLVVVRHGGLAWAHVAHIPSDTADASVYNRTLAAFDSTGRQLTAAGFRFQDVIRTWLYLGDINGDCNIGDCPDFRGDCPDFRPTKMVLSPSVCSRYDELNRARADFFKNLSHNVAQPPSVVHNQPTQLGAAVPQVDSDINSKNLIFGARLLPLGWNKPVYPASTGIGADGADVALSCIALRAERPGVALLPLENPVQTSAYDYAHQHQGASPQFARAMGVVQGEQAMVFISGTASITTAESRHLGDVEQQTRQTLDNIEGLISAKNFRAHGFPGLGSTLDDLAMVRIYVKRPEDYAAVRTICHERLGDLPATYLSADICRKELLVEIEGIAFCGREMHG